MVPSSIVAGLLAEEGVKYWLYADDGAPPGTAEITIPETSVWEEPGRYPIGWLIAKPGDSSNSLASHEYCWTDGETINWGTLVGNRVEVAAADTQARAYSDLSSGEARSRRVADTVAAGAAQEVKADIFVTERPYLYAAHWLSGQGVAFCKPAEALQLISLYLRSRGIFLVARTSGGRYTFDKGLFYWVGARAILPSGWRWFSACVLYDQVTNSDELTYLGGTAFQRVTRCLQVRDDLLRALHTTQDSNVEDDLLIAFDTILVFLMSALDACARVAHHVARLSSTDTYRAGWQNQRWLKKITTVAPAFSEVVGADSHGADILTILRLLRNTVHGVGLNALTVISRPGGLHDTLVGLPRAETELILGAVQREGGSVKWGLRETIPGVLYADPATLMERLLSEVLRLLDALMPATPVELLGVELSDGRRSKSGRDPFDERKQQSVRWQLGL
jgi:hypothetical protein